MSDPVFGLRDIEKIRTIPASLALSLLAAAERTSGLLTRRQREVARLLDEGWVAELMRPKRGPKNPNRQSRTYFLRSVRAHETDGPVVTARTIEALELAGKAVRVKAPWMANTWVFSRARYERTEMGSAPTTATPSTTSSTASSA